MNYDLAHAPNSQNLPDVVALNFGVTVVRKEDLINIAEQLYTKLYIEQKDLLDK